MERHTNKTNAPKTIKVPLQSTTKTGRPIFAYLRRSTSKKEQADSLIQQEDGIDSIIKKLGFEKENIKYYAETYSGFENKKRRRWLELTEAIEASKDPCIIIARDISRLSRNPTDSQWIMDRLYGDNKKRQLIEKIYTLDFDNTKEWNKNSDKEDVHKALSASYYDSLDTKRKSIGGILLKLEKGEFPYKAPKGLDNFVTNGKRILKQSDKMPFVKRAFEMKTEGKTHKEISKYLKQYGNIKLSDRELTDRLFKNTVYIGSYTEKTTGLYYEGLKFLEGKIPIPLALWEKVQKCLGRKISQYGEKQEGDVLASKLRTEDGRRMSKYLAKGKYTNYKNTIEKIHISELEILTNFILSIQLAIIPILVENDKVLLEFLEKEPENLKKILVEREYELGLLFFSALEVEVDTIPYEAYTNELKAILSKNGRNKESYSYDDIVKIGHEYNKSLNNSSTYLVDDFEDYVEEDIENNIIEEMQALMEKNSYVLLANMIKESPLLTIKADKGKKEAHIKSLLKQKDEIEQDKKNYRREALKMGYTKEEIDETSKDMENTIKLIEEQINEFSENTEMEGYLERLPEILSKTFELSLNASHRAEIGEMKEDIFKLLEITTFELTVNNKKELKVQLFDALDKLLSDDDSVLEAPPGVEPGYKALQASA